MTMATIYHAEGCAGGDCASYKCKCECGYAPDSFACKIRHLQVNTGDAKAGLAVPRGKQNVEITPNGRVIR
jgi:hypothetical protein